MILVLVEHSEGRPERLSLEALALASRIAAATGAPIEAVLVGADASEAAGALGGRGVDLVHAIDHDRLGSFAPAAWAAALVQLIGARSASHVIAAGSDRATRSWPTSRPDSSCRWPRSAPTSSPVSRSG
jgi:electron transfer flavoprotein alpha subunit